MAAPLQAEPVVACGIAVIVLGHHHGSEATNLLQPVADLVFVRLVKTSVVVVIKGPGVSVRVSNS